MFVVIVVLLLTRFNHAIPNSHRLRGLSRTVSLYVLLVVGAYSSGGANGGGRVGATFTGAAISLSNVFLLHQ